MNVKLPTSPSTGITTRAREEGEVLEVLVAACEAREVVGVTGSGIEQTAEDADPGREKLGRVHLGHREEIVTFPIGIGREERVVVHG